ncbi:unnamed protein product, partial [Tilletia caries]
MLTMDITTSSLSSLRLKLRVPRLPALPAPGSMVSEFRSVSAQRSLAA